MLYHFATQCICTIVYSYLLTIAHALQMEKFHGFCFPSDCMPCNLLSATNSAAPWLQGGTTLWQYHHTLMFPTGFQLLSNQSHYLKLLSSFLRLTIFHIGCQWKTKNFCKKLLWGVEQEGLFLVSTYLSTRRAAILTSCHRAHAQTHTHTHTHTYKHTHAHTRTHMHTHMHVR